MPRSLAEMAWATGTGLGLAIVAFLLTNWLLRVTESVPVWIGAGFAVLAAAELLQRRSRWRWEMRSFQVGFVALHLLTVAAVARAYLGA